MKKTTKQIHFNFTGKRFIVSGASSGIGRQIAKELGEAGATVLGLARRENELQRLQSENLERIHIAACDICDQGAVNEVISSFSAKNGKIHGCVHAAGFILPTPLNGYDATAAHTLMETHFWAGINLLKCCTRTKVAERGTSSVLFSSVDAYAASKSLFAYAAAKSALATAVRTFAKELAPKGHRVVSVSPGWVATELTEKLSQFAKPACNEEYPLGLGQPGDVAGLVLFLLSERARWITGTDIVIDGGFLA